MRFNHEYPRSFALSLPILFHIATFGADYTYMRYRQDYQAIMYNM